MKSLTTVAALVALLGASQVALLPLAAQAGLGDLDSTIDNDIQIMHGQMRSSTPHDGYRVDEIKTASRTVREYVTAEGKIFAITWRGLNHPDLSQLLSAHYKEFQDALLATPRPKVRLSHAIVRGANITVETSGYMGGALRGKAYVLSLIPAEMSINEIQ